MSKLRNRIETLKPKQLNCNFYSVYDYDGLTIQDLLNQFFTKINECIETSNGTIDLANWLVNEGLEQEVVEKLLVWLNDGTIEGLINDNIFNNLINKLEQLNSKIDNIIINLKDYEHLVNIKNDCENWEDAINQAFKDVKDGGIITIPNHTYYINQRCVLENKKNVTINNGGVFKPINGVKPIIGLLSFNNLKDCVFNGLNFNGNRENIISTNTFGQHSLLLLENSSNIVFNNLTFENTYESGFNSNGNLNNIMFNNSFLRNIGEHGFYFGGSNVKNVFFNNLTCENIGTTTPNINRSVAVIKLRNKYSGDVQHDNININGFKFTNLDNIIFNDNNTRCLIQSYDCLNINISNGEVEGDNTCLFQTNTSIDNFYVEKVKFNGKFIMYNISNKTGWNEQINITNSGKCNIVYKDCVLKGYTRYLSLTKMENCIFELTNICNDAMIRENYNILNFENCYFINCIIKNNSFRFNFVKSRKILFKNTVFNQINIGSQPLLDIGCDDETKIIIDSVETYDLLTFISSTTSVYLDIINSIIKGNIKSSVPYETINISNSVLKENRLYLSCSYNNLNVNGVYDLEGVRKDKGVFKAICMSFNTNVNLDLKYRIMEKINVDKLIIFNKKNIPFEYSVNEENLLNISTITRQDTDTEFIVLYVV